MVELGNKHQCPECEAKFYDLGKSEKICPRCGVDVETGEAPDEADGKAKKNDEEE